MALSRTSFQCSICQFKGKCSNKRMEACSVLQDPVMASFTELSSGTMTQPILRETVNTIIDGKVVKVYKDEIEKRLYKDLYSNLSLFENGN